MNGVNTNTRMREIAKEADCFHWDACEDAGELLGVEVEEFAPTSLVQGRILYFKYKVPVSLRNTFFY